MRVSGPSTDSLGPSVKKFAVDPEAAALRTNAAVAVELARAGYRGHIERLRALRRLGHVHDELWFEAVSLEKAGL